MPAGSAGPALGRVFGTSALVAGLVMLMALLITRPPAGELSGAAMSLSSFEVALRLGLAVCKLLLLENLYLNTPADQRWHVNLVCIGLGALFVYEVVLGADTVLFRRASPVLTDGRAVAAAVAAPLLALAAARNRAWRIDIHVSRNAAFHSATLVASGLFLIAIAAAGQVFRDLGPDWGGVAEIGLIFSGLLGLGLFLTSASARARARRLLVDNFFSHRFDYRVAWSRCIATLDPAGGEAAHVPLHTRIVRAVAEVVDSPAGCLLLREPGERALSWAGSWNMPAVPAPVLPDHPLLRRAEATGAAAAAVGEDGIAPLDALPPLWLAVSLRHGGRLAGLVLLAPSRAAFRLDREVEELLGMIGREIGVFVAEQQAAARLAQTRQLRAFGQRFAFVAHDIKNVSSQLSLMLANADHHLSNPEFQQDMLVTIRSSIARIGTLLRRLQTQEDAAGPVSPAERIADIARRHAGGVQVETDRREGHVAIDPAALEAILTHLTNNAREAAAERHGVAAPPVRIRLRHEGRQAVVDIVDDGPGMSPEFVRDALFQPFSTSKADGSGIGAFQARELAREAGGDLVVLSRPGAGTTMRLLLPLVEAAVPA